MLNYCVRYGYRWNHLGIVTRYSLFLFERYQSFKTTQKITLLQVIFFFKLSSRHISTSTLHSLLNFYSWPINLVIFKVSFKLSLRETHLKASFTLRCFQRLSFPDVATQLYPWRDNWYTIGPSTPVLSY